MLAALVNGQRIDPEQPALHLNERGYLYGDGLFESMLLQQGRVRFLDDHLQRLQSGCARLGIPAPVLPLLRSELQLLCGELTDGVVKLLITRGRAERGYRPATESSVTRVWQLFTAPNDVTQTGITVRWCATRMARNAALAGIKHCNRLEQVLAQAEWNDPDIAEGLMLDTEGELVCATMSNIFLVIDDVLVTPDLRYSGVHGVMRKNLLALAAQIKIPVEQRAVRAEEVAIAEELFVCNAVRGLQPVLQLDQQHWQIGSVTTRLLMALRAG